MTWLCIDLAADFFFFARQMVISKFILYCFVEFITSDSKSSPIIETGGRAM